MVLLGREQRRRLRRELREGAPGAGQIFAQCYITKDRTWTPNCCTNMYVFPSVFGEKMLVWSFAEEEIVGGLYWNISLLKCAPSSCWAELVRTLESTAIKFDLFYSLKQYVLGTNINSSTITVGIIRYEIPSVNIVNKNPPNLVPFQNSFPPSIICTEPDKSNYVYVIILWPFFLSPSRSSAKNTPS